LARALKIDPRTLRRREADGQLSGEDAAKLAAIARCDVDWLLTGKGSPPGTISDASAPHRSATDRASGSGASARERPTSDPQRPRRSEAGYLLRALTDGDPALRLQVREGGAEYGEIAAIAAHQAGQMLAERVAALFKQTFESNEIANTVAGRAFTIAFLERVVDEFGELGLNVTDMARYIIELRRELGKQ